MDNQRPHLHPGPRQRTRRAVAALGGLSLALLACGGKEAPPASGAGGRASGSGGASAGQGGSSAPAPGGRDGGQAQSGGGSGQTPDGGGVDLGGPGLDGPSDTARPTTFVHPGLLHGAADFDRMKARVAAGAQPWTAGWQRLIGNAHAQATWTPNPVAAVYRGDDGTHPQNYGQLYNDIAAAYALALRWKISGDAAYADRAIQILNAWSAVLTSIGGTSDKFLASGLYGYEIANAAEIMRTYPGWAAADFTRFQNMMLNVFYPMNHDFLVRHNDACISHYWANWDLCNMAAMLAIGVLTDNRGIYDEAVNYFKNGAGNGAIGKAVFFVHPGNLGQWQESGRDQGHNTLGIGLMGAFCEMAWKQGDDLYGYSADRFLGGAEYVAKYNLGDDVPYVTYSTCDPVVQTVIAPAGRGDNRPIWELVYNHYVNRRHLPAPNVTAYAARVRPEGGGGDYGPNSGGYDQLGYGTLTFTLDPASM